MKLGYSLLLLLLSLSTFATHNRAGEILYRRITDLEYEVTVITYTDIAGPNADRCQLDLNWGDGSAIQAINRVNGNLVNNCYQGEEIIPGTTKKNVYKATHTYPSPGTYLVGMLDMNRNANVINIPNSVNIAFYIESIIKIAPGIGPNSSPILLNAPIDEGCTGKTFEHNPGAYDPDGDSLSYALTSSLQDHNTPIPGYTFPQASNSIGINPVTGDFIWDTPTMQGEFNIAILITEWRNGQIISKILRDMQVVIKPCNNEPPEIKAVDDVCVKAGEVLVLPISATDPDTDNTKNFVKLEMTGGPFEVDFPAVFTTTNGNGTVTSNFVWSTRCSHVQKTAYSVSIKATNIMSDGSPNLVDFFTFFITVLSPGPDTIIANPIPNAIELKWTQNPCTEAVGYELYRKEGAGPFTPDACEVGVPAYTGYEKIADFGSLLDTTYLDDNDGAGLDIGVSYCYRVIGVFEDGSESFTSPETCATLKKEAPVITNVDIQTTLLSGELDLAWSKPTEFDTVVYPGPYAYFIYQSEGQSGSGLTQIATINNLNDTSLSILAVNTQNLAYSYRVDLQDLGLNMLIGSSAIASSIRLNSAGAGNRVELNWSENVNWDNSLYYIYRLNGLNYELVDSTSNQEYTDLGLENGTTYCYYVESYGSYSAPGYLSPLLNKSQISCAVPIDTVPPCKPNLNLESNCDLMENTLSWDIYYNAGCESDIDKFSIYYKAVESDPFELLVEIFTATDSVFTHLVDGSIAGCYYMTATDSNNNVSEASDVACIDNCNVFALPNVFSPNSDGENDFYTPIQSQFIDGIQISIFNRWGAKVFETTDPEINWDGTNQLTGQMCSEGVYFYDCTIYEIRLTGIEAKKIGGYIHLYLGN